MRSEKTDRGDSAVLEHLGRPVRADARRNVQALLKAAMTLFATSGVDVPMREIAERAGVGVWHHLSTFPEAG